MSGTIGIASRSFIAIAAAAVLALSGLGLFAPAAHAAPVEEEGKKYCWTTVNGQQVGHPAGTTITIVNGSSGGVTKMKCNGKTGEWEKVPLRSPGLTAGTFDSRSITLLSNTALVTSSTTSVSSSALGTLSR